VEGGVFAREPIHYYGAIPVFSSSNEYTDNYEHIAADHLTALSETGANPFIPEELWLQSEQSTIELIRKYAKAGDQILDVGVGLGRLLSHFPELRRYGMDISFKYLEVAQSKGIDVCYAMIEDMPYRPSTFDLVVCTDVLEHVIDLHQACIMILSVLKEGGQLIVRVPFRESLQQYLSPEMPYKYVHMRNFDEYSLRLLFERLYEQEFVEQTYAGYIPYWQRLRYPLPFPRATAWGLKQTLKPLKAVSSLAYQCILAKLFLPVEMNTVIKKRRGQTA
jgi:SAM-dependent methyltransferase